MSKIVMTAFFSATYMEMYAIRVESVIEIF